MAEVFNLFNVTNVLGVSNVNYSGFNNVLAPDSNDPSNPGPLTLLEFWSTVTTAGGVFGSGGPRAFQFAARVTFSAVNSSTDSSDRSVFVQRLRCGRRSYRGGNFSYACRDG